MKDGPVTGQIFCTLQVAGDESPTLTVFVQPHWRRIVPNVISMVLSKQDSYFSNVGVMASAGVTAVMLWLPSRHVTVLTVGNHGHAGNDGVVDSSMRL